MLCWLLACIILRSTEDQGFARLREGEKERRETERKVRKRPAQDDKIKQPLIYIVGKKQTTSCLIVSVYCITHEQLHQT